MHTLTSKVAYLADCSTRRDLYGQSIADERAYVTAWLTRTRDGWLAQGTPSFFVARQPSYLQEVANGIDALLVVKIDNYYKAIGIEAKRPGLGVARPWDKFIAKAGMSHYHRQLLKQQALVNCGWTMGSLFLNEICPGTVGPPGTDLLGATFAPRAPLLAASSLITKPAPHHWKTSDLLPLLAIGPTYNVEELLELVIECSLGHPMSAEQLVQSSMMFSAFDREDSTQLEHAGDPLPRTPVGHPSTVLLRNLCHFTGARAAVLLDATLPDRDGASLPAAWRERIIDEKLPPPSDDDATPSSGRF
ncbi:hypothetical protein [Xanthomonas arboricola]|uniref:hypothetical protein n=1 Tax=Xanthomonas arboricola TaxID=56448 RepID=UPI0016213975|nr:hypothetical protein [Xanthomonas arboricola]MBB5859024.1 hypothetical protein [Xanthomonas arboricola]